MKSTARAKFSSGTGPQRIWIKAIFVIPSEVEESRCVTSKVFRLGVSTSRNMTASLSLYRRRRHNFDAVDHDTFGRLAWFAHVIFDDRDVTDFLQHIIAFDQFAERRVLMVESVYGCETDEELRAGGVGIWPA